MGGDGYEANFRFGIDGIEGKGRSVELDEGSTRRKEEIR